MGVENIRMEGTHLERDLFDLPEKAVWVRVMTEVDLRAVDQDLKIFTGALQAAFADRPNVIKEGIRESL